VGGQNLTSGVVNNSPGGWSKSDQGVVKKRSDSVPQSGTSCRKTKAEVRSPLRQKTPHEVDPENTTTTRGASRPDSSSGPSVPPSAEDQDQRPPQAASGIGSGSEGEADEYTPDEKANLYIVELPKLLKKLTGVKPSIGQHTVMAAKEFFQINRWSTPEMPTYNPWDVYYICVMGWVLASANPEPEPKPGSTKPPFDPYFYCRRYANKPSRIFDLDSQDDMILFQMKREIKYDQPFSNSKLLETITAEIKKAMAARGPA
jgi:hypothetical protein